MLSQRELDEVMLEAEAELAEILGELERDFLGERASYMTPEEVTNAGSETAEEDLYVQDGR